MISKFLFAPDPNPQAPVGPVEFSYGIHPLEYWEWALITAQHTRTRQTILGPSL